MLHDLKIIPLHSHCDARGRVMEILRRDDPHFHGFGQAYFSTIYPGVVKAWHAHLKQHDAMTAIKGMCRIGLFDDRPNSPTQGQAQEVVTGEFHPLLLIIPPGVFHGFKAIGTAETLLVNLPSEPYNPQEPDELRRPWNDPTIPFNWETEFK
jgi:dTDP-4-dehydrorhamnose 3,5-epimerase